MIPRATWLDGELDGPWEEVSYLSTNPLDLSPSSCFRGEEEVFCVVRERSPSFQQFRGLIISDRSDEEFLVVVSRLYFGRKPGQDVGTTPPHIITTRSHPSLVRLITSARNFASYNGYSSPPPFVFWLAAILHRPDQFHFIKNC